MKCHRYRNGNIDPHHADLDIIGESACGIPIASKDRYTVAILVITDHLDSLVVVLGANNRESRAEDLLLVNGHFRSHPVKYTAPKEKAVLAGLILGCKSAPVDQQFGTLFLTNTDIFLNLFLVLATDHRPHLGGLIGPGTNDKASDLGQQFFNQPIRHLISHWYRDRNGHTTLSGRAVGGTH